MKDMDLQVPPHTSAWVWFQGNARSFAITWSLCDGLHVVLARSSKCHKPAPGRVALGGGVKCCRGRARQSVLGSTAGLPSEGAGRPLTGSSGRAAANACPRTPAESVAPCPALPLLTHCHGCSTAAMCHRATQPSRRHTMPWDPHNSS